MEARSDYDFFLEYIQKVADSHSGDATKETRPFPDGDIKRIAGESSPLTQQLLAIKARHKREIAEAMKQLNLSFPPKDLEETVTAIVNIYKNITFDLVAAMTTALGEGTTSEEKKKIKTFISDAACNYISFIMPALNQEPTLQPIWKNGTGPLKALANDLIAKIYLESEKDFMSKFFEEAIVKMDRRITPSLEMQKNKKQAEKISDLNYEPLFLQLYFNALGEDAFKQCIARIFSTLQQNGIISEKFDVKKETAEFPAYLEKLYKMEIQKTEESRTLTRAMSQKTITKEKTERQKIARTPSVEYDYKKKKKDFCINFLNLWVLAKSHQPKEAQQKDSSKKNNLARLASQGIFWDGLHHIISKAFF